MISALGNGGGLATLMAGVQRMQGEQQTLAAQASSGLISDDISGLGARAGSVLRLQPQLSALSACQGAMTQAQAGLSVSATALTGMQDIATSLSTSLVALQSDGSTDKLSAVTGAALAGLSNIKSLLNTQSAGRYVFSGTASDTPVIESGADLSSGTLADAVQSALNDNPEDASAAMSAILAAAGSDIPFSSPLTSVPATALQSSTVTGPQARQATGYVATSAGTSSDVSTGSPVRDLIAGLSVLAGLSPTQLQTAQSSGLLSKLGQMVSSAASGLVDANAGIGAQQQALTAQSSVSQMMSTALSTQYGDLTDVDLATVATQQSAVQSQLTASYSLIADMKNLSLAAYL